MSDLPFYLSLRFSSASAQCICGHLAIAHSYSNGNWHDNGAYDPVFCCEKCGCTAPKETEVAAEQETKEIR